jgi:hypothetical protein
MSPEGKDDRTERTTTAVRRRGKRELEILAVELPQPGSRRS